MNNSRKKLTVKIPPVFLLIRFLFPILEKVAPALASRLSANLFFTPIRFGRPQKELAIHQLAVHHELIVDTIACKAYEWGAGDSTVLLVHGWAGRASQYHLLIQHLVEKGYRVVGFDAPGHGDSKGKQSSILLFASCISAMVKMFVQPVAIVGHSLGGVGAMLAIGRGLQIGKLVTISSPVIAEDILDTFRAKINGSPKVNEWIKSEVRRTYDEEFIEYSGMHLSLKMNPMPYLIIHDEVDSEAGIFHAEALQAQLPWANHFYTSGLGHTRILSSPEVHEQIVKFLSV